VAAVNRLAAWSRRRGHDLHLIDRRSHSIFSPVLPDLVSGRIRPEHISHPLEAHCRQRGVRFTQAQVQGFLPGFGGVITDAGEFKADFMILCTGCDTNYFGNREMEQKTIGLKSPEDGRRIRESILQMAGAWARKESAQIPEILVIGGGYTGFEVASHAAHLLRAVTRVPFAELPEKVARITILEKGEEVLHNVSPDVRRWAQALLKGYGVAVQTGATVESFRDAVPILTDGRAPANALCVWTVGVTPGEAVTRMESPKVAGRRLQVDEHLRLPGIPHLFAAGDVAGPIMAGATAPLRMSVQFSLTGGWTAAANVIRTLEKRPLRRYAPADLGYVIPLAPGRAAGVVLGREMHGRLPALLHYFMTIFRTWGWRNRAGILTDLLRG
jgi:NADH dehydrogenase